MKSKQLPVLILDFGSQYTQLIARRIRSLKVYCEIHPFTISYDDLLKLNPQVIVLSGGPENINNPNAPQGDERLLKMNRPILGICYGYHWMAKVLGGIVESTDEREYGYAEASFDNSSLLFRDIEKESHVWMSHGDTLVKIPDGFIANSHSEGIIAAIENADKKLFGVQFHPEVTHTTQGIDILKKFLFDIAQLAADWKIENFLQIAPKKFKKIVGKRKLTLGLSGGIDSTVLAVLFDKIFKDQVQCIFIDNGLLRKNEREEITERFENELPLHNFLFVDAEKQFLEALKGVENPEQKRKIIGRIFLDVFNKAAGNIDILIQGTLYPDIIESINVVGPSQTIKTHHNRVAEIISLIDDGRILEPFKEFFKDEVRELARALNIPEHVVNRHPFPGPGLAIRIIGPVTKERLDILRNADHIYVEELHKAGLYNNIGQAFSVLLPIKSVGVMGDARSYENVLALRAVDTTDYMTANCTNLPHEFLTKVATKIINKVSGINRVVFDLSSKPPSTIEWE
jgi:GMP synthase (glutamine-hydrolysing)